MAAAPATNGASRFELIAIDKVAISKLKLDESLYPRHSLDTMNVARLADALRAGVSLPPIVVEDKTFRLVDGFHRVRAWQQVHGPGAELPAEFRKYTGDAALFEDAVRLNAQHGMPLSSYDQARCLARAEELALKPERIINALAITRERFDRIVKQKLAQVNGHSRPIKRTLAHLAGRDMTPDQVEANEGAGGMNQLFYVTQLITLIQHDSLDTENKRLIEQLRKLHELLESVL